jgi:cyclopropane fatty-acyl-phospholipid synthase-like methyltransferase
MPEKDDVVGATHEFHSVEYARWWSERFEVTPERRDCFEHLADLLAPSLKSESVVLELGIGPGYLAQHLLRRFTKIRYCGLDYSAAMLEIAKARLAEFSPRIALQRIDLTAAEWEKSVCGPFAAIVSTWALHDLGREDLIGSVYEAARSLLHEGGVLVNVDFIRPAAIDRSFEGGRLLASAHVALLKKAGFFEVACSKEFAVDLDNPTSASNYACLKGRA